MNPTNIEQLILDIETLKANQDYASAQAQAIEGLKVYTDDYRLYEELADIYLFDGKFDMAGEVLAIARELHPASSTGMYLDGYIATAKGEFDRAIETLGEANKNIPNNPEILRNLGWAYVMSGNLGKGVPLLRRAHILAPDEPMVINDLSVALIASGQEDEAKVVLAKLGRPGIHDAISSSSLL